MKETNGLDIFDQMAHANAICITTNCSITKDGINPMGALAGAAAKRWQELPAIYGKYLTILPNVPVILGWVDQADPTEFASSLENDEIEGCCAIVAYPTMPEFGEPADFDLVIRSANLLVEMADFFGWKEVYTGVREPGLAGLDVKTVHDALKIIFDDRFTVMQK